MVVSKTGASMTKEFVLPEAPEGWTEVHNVNYTTWFDNAGRAAVEWYHSGRV
jgi:hypothetical protein